MLTNSRHILTLDQHNLVLFGSRAVLGLYNTLYASPGDGITQVNQVLGFCYSLLHMLVGFCVLLIVSIFSIISMSQVIGSEAAVERLDCGIIFETL